MATTMEVAEGMKALIEQNKLAEAIDTYYADNICSTEPMGETPSVTGLDAIRQKMANFQSAIEIHAIACKGPHACSNQFILEMSMEATDKKSGEKIPMHELGLYTVEDGKIVDEKFFFNMNDGK